MAKKETIEDLFRDELEGAEIRPSAKSWKSIRRGYRVNRFFRFTPRNLNIYYLGALGLAAAGILLFSTGEEGMPPDTEQATLPEVPALVQRDVNPEPGIRKDEEAGRPEQKGEGSSLALADPPAESPQHEAVDAGIREEQTVPEPSMKKIPPAGESRTGMREEQARNMLPVASFSAVPVEGCGPLGVQFINESRDASRYVWDFGDGSSSGSKEPAHVFEFAGTYTVTMRALNDAGEVDVQSTDIEVHPCPRASVDLVEGLPGTDGSRSIQAMNYSSGGLDYSWNLLDERLGVLEGWSSDAFQPEFFPDDLPAGAKWIRLVVTSIHLCTDTSIAVLPAATVVSERELRFATAFEADRASGGYIYPGETRNDIFHPVFTEQPAEYHLQVFSRMGGRVFESRDLYRGWDGYVRQQRATAGVYLWICEGSWDDGTSFSYKGDVTLFWKDGQWP